MRKTKYRLIVFLAIYLSMITFWILGFNYNEFFNNKDNMDYAQMGREIKNGKGFSTLQLFPGHLRYMKERGMLEKENIPNLYRFPLPTISNAFFQLLIKDPVRANIIQSGFWMLITIPFLYLIISGLSGLFPAIAGMLFFFFDNLIMSYSGMGETLTTFWIVILFWFIFRKTRVNMLLPGMALGFLFLARSLFLFLLPLFIIFYLIERAGWKKILIFVAGFFIISGGWMIRNLSVTGSPLFSLTNTRNLNRPYTEERIDPFYTVNMDYSTLNIARENSDIITNNIKENSLSFFSISFWWNNLSVYSIFLLLTLLFSIFFKNKFLNRRFSLIILVFISTFIVYTPFLLIPRWFIPIKPLLLLIFLIYSQKFFTYLLKKIKLKVYVVSLLIFSLAVSILISWDLPAYKIEKFISRKGTAPKLHFFRNLKKIVNDEVVLSDISYKIALLCNIRSIRAPIHPEEIDIIDKKYLKVPYILLSMKLPRKMRKNYLPYLKEKLYLDNYEVAKEIKGYLLLRRRGI